MRRPASTSSVTRTVALAIAFAGLLAAVGTLRAASAPSTRCSRPGCATAALRGARHAATNVPVPASGAYWGAFVDYRLASVSDRESQLGLPFGVVHFYHDWSERWGGADPTEQQLADNGQIVFDSVEPLSYRTGAIIPWARIADGSQDAHIDRLASFARTLGHPMFVGFGVEPESEIGPFGSAADYAAAFRHMVERFRADGATNVSWVWQTEGWVDHYAQYRSLYPGNDVVDWIAWDPYNWSSCNGSGWQSFEQVVQPFYSWLSENGFAGKPFMLGEYGSAAGPGKPAWFRGALATMKAHRFPNLKALVYFDSPKQCTWRLDSSAAALDAFAAMGSDSFFHP